MGALGRAGEGGAARGCFPRLQAAAPSKVFTSLEDIKPWQPTADLDPAPDLAASDILPPPKWPKPVM